MGALAVVEARADELTKSLKKFSEKRAALIDGAIAEKRGLSDDEAAKYADFTSKRDAAKDELARVDDRIAELRAQAENAERADEVRRVGGAKVTEPPVYRADNALERSWFRDLFDASQRNDADAAERLRRNASIEQEKRADEVGTVVGSGIPSGNAGVFAPPTWLVAEYVKLARPGRVGVDTFDKMPLPSGTSSISIPKVTGGTATGLQPSGELSSLPEQDITTGSVSTGITTIGGKQLVSLQLLEQSAIPFDRVILEDLALAYAANVDLEGLTQTGTGGHLRSIGAASGLVTQTYTDASPAFVGKGKLYNQILLAGATVHANRFLSPDTCLMHPTRWSWICGQYDSANRPVVLPEANGPFNAITTDVDLNVAQGRAGRLGGMDVFVDPQIPTTGGQDVIYVYRRGDIKLWESGPRFESFTATYADSAGVLFRALGYAGMIPDRYGSSIVQVSGTGLAFPPAF